MQQQGRQGGMIGGGGGGQQMVRIGRQSKQLTRSLPCVLHRVVRAECSSRAAVAYLMEVGEDRYTAIKVILWQHSNISAQQMSPTGGGMQQGGGQSGGQGGLL